ncbi:MAG: YraN family protein [Cyclobacteriaceae bacterium]
MRTTTSIGNEGERKAQDYLASEGCTILETNFRYKRGEIDIIAQKNDILLFIEVKQRKNSQFGSPEGFVDSKKEALIQSVAEDYLEKKNWSGRIRFDILSIESNTGNITYFEDAF